MAKLTAARQRVLLFMAQTGCTIDWVGNGHGWTDDEYQWPIAEAAIRAMARDGLIDLAPKPGRPNTVRTFAITPQGRAALLASLSPEQ